MNPRKHTKPHEKDYKLDRRHYTTSPKVGSPKVVSHVESHFPEGHQEDFEILPRGELVDGPAHRVNWNLKRTPRQWENKRGLTP